MKLSIIALVHEMSFKSGVFPHSLKAAKVAPVFKKGCKYAIENYRPISDLPVLSKVFERVLSTKLLSFFNQNSVRQCIQYGFRKKHNTTHAVFHVITHIYDNIFSNNFSCVLTLNQGWKPVMEYSSTVLVLEYHFWGTRTRNPWYSVSTRTRRSMYSVKKSAEYTSTFGFR